MIHINKHSNSSPPLSSTMCGRRHKGMVQTSLILVLLVCLGYGFYLYNVLQVKLKYLDTKSLRHQSEQQSLSAQLQTAYEDRARLEKSVQNSRNDFQKLKDEKEAMIQGMLIEHQDKNQKLQKENKDLKDKNKDLSASNQDLKTKHDRVYKDHEELKSKHQKSLLEHGEMVNIAHVDLQHCQAEKEAVQQDNIHLKQQIDDLNADYRSLQDTLKLIPADAVNFNHPATRSIKPDVKQFILGHLGERRDDLVQAEQRLAGEQVQAIQPGNNNQQQDEHPPLDALQNGPQHGDQFMGSEVVDICGYHVEHGPCQTEELRYGYYNDVGECRGFTYGGCGGNLNNFKTKEGCVSVCKDPAQRYLRKKITDEEIVGRMQKQGVIDHNGMAPVEEQQSDNEPPGIHQVVAQENGGGAVIEAEGIPDQDGHGIDDGNGNLPLEQQNVVDAGVEEDQSDQDADDDEDEQSKLINEAEIQAIGEEEAAKQELENQQEHVTVLSDGENALERLKENSRLQAQMAMDQQANMEKALGQNHREQNPDQIEAQIVDEMNKDEEDLMHDDGEEVDEDDENDLEDMQDEVMKDDSEHVQVVVPPAAQVAERDPEAFMNAPPGKNEDIDSEDVNGHNIFEVDNENDRLMRDGQEEGFYEQDNQQDDDDPGLAGDPGEEEDDDDQNDEFDDDKIDDQKFEDDYANDVEDPNEKNYREQREKNRIFHDKNFDAMNNVQNMIPQLNFRQK